MEKKAIFYILLFLFVFNFFSFSQNIEGTESKSTSGSSSMDILEKFYRQGLADKLGKSLSFTPIDGIINPDEYILGPNDILQLNVFGGISFDYSLRVTPEGMVVIPTVNEVSVKNLSLSAAKIKIIEEIKKKYKVNNISVTLNNPRQFNVNVTGIVDPGSFVVSAFDRVDKIVYLSTRQIKIKPEKEEILEQPGKETSSKEDIKSSELFRKLPYVKEAKEEKNKNQDEFSLRKIKIYRKNGDTLSVDLIKFYMTGDLKYNPYLSDGDVVFIPAVDLKGNSVTVFGAVKNPGAFEFCQGDNISALLDLVQGPSVLANLKEVGLTRVDSTWQNITTSIINVESILNHKSEDILLKGGDRLFFREKVRIHEDREVILKGEIWRPGKYPIIKGVTKLSEVIESAGGFTEFASLYDAKVIRKKILDDDLESNPDYNRLRNLRLGKLDKYEMEYFNLEEAIKRNLVVVDFKKLFIDKDKKADIILQGNETIIIPSNMHSVMVYGQVANPGAITFVTGMDYKYYIEKAGGFSDGAVKSDVKIIKAGSKNWVDPGKTTLENGDTIWVPKETIREFDYWWNLFRDIGSVIISVSTLIVLIVQINKK
jgi:protein involved in polysaccharide export with SLBB domain